MANPISSRIAALEKRMPSPDERQGRVFRVTAAAGDDDAVSALLAEQEFGNGDLAIIRSIVTPAGQPPYSGRARIGA